MSNKLIIIPSAGSMGFEYANIIAKLKDISEVYVVKYKGRGQRICEGYSNTWDELVEDVFMQVKENIDYKNYIILGHSMGSTIAYETYYKIIESNIKQPKAICFCGNESPNTMDKKLKSKLNDKEFKDYFIKLGGISKEVLECDELSQMVFEILRQDINLLESYNYKERNHPIKSDVFVINGKEDNVRVDEKLWNKAVKTSVNFIKISGGHFFMFKYEDEFLNEIKKIIQ